MAGETLKQRKFRKKLIKTLSPTEAAFRAYNCKDRKVAAVIASQNLLKLNISLPDLMDSMGLTDEEDVKDLQRLRKAQKLQTCDIYVKKEDGKVTINKNSNDFIEVDDNAIQIKALELSLRLKGRLKDKVEHSVDDSIKSLLNAALDRLG